jgi:outer membrane protein assembly factor BamB
MMRMRWLMVVVVVVLGGFHLGAHADWPHWRGHGGNGVSLTARPPVDFGLAKNLRWKAEIPGRGSSSPAVLADRVFVSTAVPVEEEGRLLDFRLLCFDRETGRERWSRSAVKSAPHEGTHETNGYASASPCTDGELVYAHFGSQGLHCFTVDGEHIWSRDFGDMRIRNGFGEGSSPTLAGELVIVPWDHEGPSMLYALDKRTGKTVWETPRDEPTSWCTPLIVADAGGTMQVVMNGQNAARGYELATGKELWQCGGQTVRPCPSALAADGVAYIGSGYRGAFLGAFNLAGRGDLAGSGSVRWEVHRNTPDVASPLLSGDRLYFYKEKTGLLTCLDCRTGEPHYETARIPGVGRTYASPVAAGGHVYLTDRGGRITVIEDGDAVRVVAENDVEEGVDATPAPDGDSLFVRGERHLFRFAEE